MSNTGADVASAVAGGVDPHWLARIDASLGGWATRQGTLVVALVAVEVLIGLAALSRRPRAASAAAGLLLGLAFWLVGQDMDSSTPGRRPTPTGTVTALVVALLLGYCRPRGFSRAARFRLAAQLRARAAARQ